MMSNKSKNNMNKHQILQKAYNDLNLSFDIDFVNHLHIKTFDCDFFKSIEIKPITEHKYVVNKGLNKFQYHNIYEVLLWLYYYTIKNKHIEHTNYEDNCYHNKSYFSRIPSYYRNIDSKIGMNIVKRVLDKIIENNNGVPIYYDPKILKEIMIIKKH